jgi:hypothetical protein
MAEQTLEIRAVNGLTNVTMFVKDTDTVEDIATGAVAGAVVAGSTVYRHTFTDLVAATRLVGLRDANGVIADTLITIGATTGVYRATSNADLKTVIAGIDAGSGAGARTITITVTDGTDPLQNARVRLTEGANTFTALTNVSGVATLNVDDATYTVAITKSSYSFAGASLVVDGDEAETYAMTLVSVVPPVDPQLSAIEVLCLGADFQAEADVDIDFRMVTIPSGDTNKAYPGAKTTVASAANGVARFEGPRGSVIQYKRGRADVWLSVTLDSDSATNVTSFIGSP